MKKVVLVPLLACLLAGCNWTRLLAFREQMRSIDDYASWESGSKDPAFLFRSPLLTLGDLNEFGLFPEMLDDRHAAIRYRRVIGQTLTADEYEIRFLFTNGRLAGLALPAKLREGLGRENIRRFFALLGGAGRSGSGLAPVSKRQLVDSGLFGGLAEQLGPEAVVDLEPVDPRNRPIYLKLTEGKRADHYSGFHLSLRRRDQR